MIAVIGMTSNFIAEMVTANLTPSEVLVGTLSVVSPVRLDFCQLVHTDGRL